MLEYGEGNGNPLQYSSLENPMDRGAWWATVHRVAKSWTGLSGFTFTFMEWWFCPSAPDAQPYICASCSHPSPMRNFRQHSLSPASLRCPWQPHLLMLKCDCRVGLFFVFFFFWKLFEMNCWCCSFCTSFNLCRIHSRNLPAWVQSGSLRHIIYKLTYAFLVIKPAI